jgi:hypothetical protein
MKFQRIMLILWLTLYAANIGAAVMNVVAQNYGWATLSFIVAIWCAVQVVWAERV